MSDNYIFFWSRFGNFKCFSQFHAAKFVNEDGILFSCAEQYMMYSKAILMNDQVIAQQILSESNPKSIKSLGRKIKNFDQNKWDMNKEEIVYMGNFYKFSQNDDLKKILANTKDKVLVEASPYDLIWGIGLSEKDAKNMDPKQWPGQNLLGKQLMKVRADLFIK